MASIFLSYAREDSSVARALAGALERIGHSVWWDRHIKGGSQFAAEIEAALEKAEAVVVLWSATSVTSPWVRDEASSARDSGRLVPSTLDNTLPPMGFRQYQAVDLSGWKGRRNSQRFVRLTDAIDRVVTGRGTPEISTARPGREGSLPWRRLVVALVALLALGAATAVYLYRYGGSRGEPIAMAVMPFDALPADQTNGPFAEGLSEEISGELARNPRLQLIGRTSASMFKDSNADAKTIGRKLRIRYLLDGSVQRAGKEIRIAVELIRTGDGIRIWRQTYRGTIDNLFAIQDRIGSSVEGQLRAKFVGNEGVNARSLATRGDVYGYYLTARSILRNPGEGSDSREASIRFAEELLRKAVALDPNYAPAWAQLSGAVLVQREFPTTSHEAAEKLKRSAGVFADRALKLAPQLAEAHYAKARSVVGSQGRSAENLRGLQTAARLDPNSPDVWFSLGNYYEWMGDFEAALQARRKAYQLDPLWIFAVYPVIDSTWQLGYEEEALRYARRTEQDGSPQPFQAHMIRGDLASLSGDWSGALAELLAARRAADAARKPFANYIIASALRAVGDLDRARLIWPGGVDDLVWKLWHGEPLGRAEIVKLATASGSWSDATLFSVLLKSLVSHGRSAEAVELYKQRYGIPEKIQPYARPHLETIGDLTTVGVALENVGRANDAARLLSIVRESIEERFRRGRVPRNYYYYASLTAAAQGDDRVALQWLEHADANRWWYTSENFLTDLAGEPAFAKLKGNPRFEAVAARQRARQAKERREMAPLLAQLAL